MQKTSSSRSGFFNPRVLTTVLLCGAACSIVTGTLLGFFRAEASPNGSQRTLTFAERVSYQRAIEDVYWLHRIWPKERPDAKPSLDAVMSQAQLEKKVEDYLRKSQALEDYWQRPITGEQLRAEMDRMAKHTKQPEMLHELFAALGNDPFVIAECLARPALADRLLTNWYAYDQRIHAERKQRAQADLLMRPSAAQMKQLSGAYSEIELVKDDTGETVRQAHRLLNQRFAGGAPALQRQDATHSVKLNSSEWDQTVRKLAASFGNSAVAAGVSPARDTLITQVTVGRLSSLQENETHYYATAVVSKTADFLKLATVSWLKEPLESWLARTENHVPTAIAALVAHYKLPQISGEGCTDDTWAATDAEPFGRFNHTAVWTGAEMIIWGGDAGSLSNTGGRYAPATDIWTPTSTTNAPAGRDSHTAVWTGTEMIVWGGYDGGHPNTGGRYNPGTDSWTATSTVNAPTGRESHTAVWTGNEMIVWGGIGDSGLVNTGGRYNPNTDSWTATSTTNAPSGRSGHTAVWTGSEMIIWGGYDGTDDVNTGARYNPNANTWTATSTTNAPDARGAHTAVWAGSEMIVWGGSTFDSTGGRYNPSTNSWSATSTINAPSGRYAHTAVWSGNQMIVWGGTDGNNEMNNGGIYTPGTNSWAATSTTNAPSGRWGHKAVWSGSEMIVWGGYSEVNTGGRYDPNTDTWTGTAVAPCARGSHTAVWTGTEMIVWGGYGGCGGSLDILNTGGRYSPITDTWTATATTNAPQARDEHTAVWTGIEMIVWGGDAVNSTGLNTGGKYNPGTDSWMPTSITNAPHARLFHTAVWSGAEMIVWGGYFRDAGNDNYLDTGGKYNPTVDSWTDTSTTSVPVTRAYHTAVWTGTEMVVWGGYYFDGINNYYLNSGGKYNPDTNSWTATSTTGAPVERDSHTAVWTGDEMIVWGGFAPNYSNSGGKYNPITDSWAATSVINAPTPRLYHTAVWTGNEMITWGGIASGNTRLNTGGRYTPGTDSWTATSLVNAPVGRGGHTAVWTGDKMVVWGGDYHYPPSGNRGGRYCVQSGPPPSPTPTPTASPGPTSTPTSTATATTTPSGTPTATPTPSGTATNTPSVTPTVTASPTTTPRVTPTPRIHPTARQRPTPPSRLTPVPPPPSPQPTAAPRPTPPPHLTPVPPPPSPRPTPHPRP